MKAQRVNVLVGFALAIVCMGACGAFAEQWPARSREFLFGYRVSVTGLNADQVVRIWVPVPPSNDDQQVSEIDRKLPAPAKIGEERRFHNRILYTQAKPGADGSVELSFTYHVLRREVRSDATTRPSDEIVSPLYLMADARVPVGGKALKLIEGKALPEDPVACARVLYDVVFDHMVYRKDKPGWGNGDSDWACDSGYGNCTDFHSLFISLARARKIPAKFEIGFPLPPERGAGTIPGYHCWAEFKPRGRDWMPVDISEARQHPELRQYYFGNLTENRVMFSTGRDLVLTPKQDGPPLNYFIYPYVEVDGKPWPAEKIKRTFTYQDISPGISQQPARSALAADASAASSHEP